MRFAVIRLNNYAEIICDKCKVICSNSDANIYIVQFASTSTVVCEKCFEEYYFTLFHLYADFVISGEVLG